MSRMLRLRHVFARLPGQRHRATRAALNGHLRQALTASRLGELPPEVLDGGGTFVDVGAGVGDWSLAALDLVAPERIVAIESSPGALAHLTTALGYRAEVRIVGPPVPPLDEVLAEEPRLGVVRLNDGGPPAGASETLARAEAVLLGDSAATPEIEAMLREQGLFAFRRGIYLRSGRDYGSPPASLI
jgi:hypothetical protein